MSIDHNEVKIKLREKILSFLSETEQNPNAKYNQIRQEQSDNTHLECLANHPKTPRMSFDHDEGYENMIPKEALRAHPDEDIKEKIEDLQCLIVPINFPQPLTPHMAVKRKSNKFHRTNVITSEEAKALATALPIRMKGPM